MMVAFGSVGLFVFAPPVFLFYNVRRGLPIDRESKGLLIFLAAVLLSVFAILAVNQILRSLG